MSKVNLSEFEALKPQSRGLPCWMQRAETVLSRGEMSTLLAGLEHGYSARIIAQWLTQRGFPISRSQVAVHRRGECNCER